MTFVDECLFFLGGNSRLLSSKEENDVIAEVESKYPFNSWGRIVWDNVTNKRTSSVDKFYDDLSDLGLIKNFGSSIYIIWNVGLFSSIYSDIERIKETIDYLIIGHDTYLYAASGGYIVELHHEGAITIGWSLLV